MNTMLNEIAAIYARASTDKQGDTIEHQISLAKEWSERFDMPFHFDEKYIFTDEGESGYKTTLLQRPAMSELLRYVELGIIKVIIFKGISRFARDSGEAITTVKRLVGLGVRVISIEENYDSIKDDPTFFQIYAVMAEAESRKTSIRVSLGNKQKARTGVWPAGNTPFGYTKVKFLDEETKTKALSQRYLPGCLYPDENAVIVRTIFDMYVNEGHGRKKIVSHLNSLGYRNNGNLFQDRTIKSILENEVYTGTIIYGKTRYYYVEDPIKNKKIQRVKNIDEKDWIVVENAHPAIIDKELFLKAKSISNSKNPTINKKRFNAAKHPLTGLLKCGKCGAPMICQKRSNKKADGSKIEYRYYVCSTYHKKGRDICSQANVNADNIEDAVFHELGRVLNKYITEDIADPLIVRNETNKLHNDIRLLENRIQKSVDGQKALLESKQFMDEETFQNMMLDYKKDIEEMRSKKIEIEKQIELKELTIATSSNVFKDYISEFTKVDPSDLDKKREILHYFIEKVTLVSNTEIEVAPKFEW